jgi:hypothetical protein
MKKEKILTNKDGSSPVTVDTSPEAFAEAGYPGFSSGQTVVDIDHDVTVLEGIGYGLGRWASKKVLWCTKESGKIAFYYYNMSEFLIPVKKGYKFC